jgi:SUKH-3 immunity protein
MKFKKEVEDLLRKAGWYPGRSVKEKFDAIPRFNEFPQIAKDFLYEYGDLEIKTHMRTPDDAIGVINTKALLLGYYKINNYLANRRYYGNVMTFPLADYRLDSAAMECDAEGRIYMSSDGPNLMSNNFIEGIERVIMEDYSDVFWWDDEKQKWSQEDMFGG